MTTRKVFEPHDAAERFRGWLLHAHKCRDRHDEAARGCEATRYLLGVPAIVLSTIAGASAFASLHEPLGTAGRVLAGTVGITAAVLVALQTFFDHAARAERHRVAAVKYKALIRELEQALTGDTPREDPQDVWATEFRVRLDSLEEITPSVGRAVYDRVERKYTGVAIVATIGELAARGNGRP